MDFDQKLIDAMSDDVIDWIHATSPEQFDDETVHQFGALILLASLAKLDVIIPTGLN